MQPVVKRSRFVAAGEFIVVVSAHTKMNKHSITEAFPLLQFFHA